MSALECPHHSLIYLICKGSFGIATTVPASLPLSALKLEFGGFFAHALNSALHFLDFLATGWEEWWAPVRR